MKIIDLIDDIRNKKELPKKIKIKDYVFELDENFEYKGVYSCETAYLDGCNYWLRNGEKYDFWLSDEVEIIEEVEDKEYEDIDIINGDYIVPNTPATENEAYIMACFLAHEQIINALIRNQKKIIEVLNDKDKDN